MALRGRGNLEGERKKVRNHCRKNVHGHKVGHYISVAFQPPHRCGKTHARKKKGVDLRICECRRIEKESNTSRCVIVCAML